MECRQISRAKKLKQLEDTYDRMALMLKREGYIAYNKGISFQNDDEMRHYINHNIDVRRYFEIEYGQNIPCIRTSCNNAYGANFFKSDDGTTLYKCHLECAYQEETIALYELICDVFKQQHKLYKADDYYTLTYKIKLLFCPDFESEFYKEYRAMINHNRALIEGLHHKKYLKVLFKRRNLMECYKDFTEIAIIYMREDEEIPYSFYCSNGVIKRTLRYVFGKNSGSNYQIDKINILVALGLVEKLDEEDCPKRMRDKIIRAKMIASQGKPFLYNSTSAYRMRKLTLEDLEEAERRAKILVENKIYTVKKDTFKEIEIKNKKETQRNETFIKRAKKAIKEELKKKGYIQLSKVVSKIDPKYKYYKTKKEKEELLDYNLKRIMSDYKLEIVLVNNEAREKFKLTKSVKDNAELLIKKSTEFNNKKKSSKNDEVFIESVEINSKGDTVVYAIDDSIDTSDAPF